MIRRSTKPAFPAQQQEEIKMEAYRIERFGSVDGIVLRSSEDPRPGPKEILMRVRASSLNYCDLKVLKGGGAVTAWVALTGHRRVTEGILEGQPTPCLGATSLTRSMFGGIKFGSASRRSEDATVHGYAAVRF